jgi:hypothetical protein
VIEKLSMAEKEAASYEAIADYWDAHEVSDENSEPVEIEVDLQRVERSPKWRTESTSSFPGVARKKRSQPLAIF